MTVTILRRLLKLMILCSAAASILEAGLLAYDQWLTATQATEDEDDGYFDEIDDSIDEDDDHIFVGGVTDYSGAVEPMQGDYLRGTAAPYNPEAWPSSRCYRCRNTCRRCGDWLPTADAGDDGLPPQNPEEG